MTILQSAKDKINQRALARYLKNKKTAERSADIKELLRKDDQEQKLNSSGRVSGGVFDRLSVCPDGYKRFQIKQSARARRDAGEAASGGASAPWVLPAKSQSHFIEEIDHETGEIQRLTVDKRSKEFVPVFDENESLVNRYILQAEARKILKSETKLNESGRPVPVYRVCDCLRNPASGVKGVRVVSSQLSERARFAGLQTCGSVWHCPICSARVSEVRRKQIREMVDIWQKCGKGVIFITNTIRHHFDDDLRLMLSNLLDTVWNRYINHRAYKNLRKDLGYIGRVRSIEVTYGENGWHPHVHEIWLIEKTLSPAELRVIKRKLFKVWNTTLLNAGMSSVTLLRGVTVQNGSNASDYIAKFGQEPKWDIGRELTQGHSKKSNGKGRTPFDLLRDSVLGDKDAARLFKEYAIAFSGKRQLYFSTGLKDFFQIDYKTDEDIASSADYDSSDLAYLDSDSWRYVLVFGSRAEVLLIAQSGGSDAVALYVAGLRFKQEKTKQFFILSNT
jgi:Replication protein